MNNRRMRTQCVPGPLLSFGRRGLGTRAKPCRAGPARFPIPDRASPARHGPARILARLHWQFKACRAGPVILCSVNAVLDTNFKLH